MMVLPPHLLFPLHIPPSPPLSPGAGTVRDKLQEWFVGGSVELEKLDYLTVPATCRGRVLNKY